MPCLLAIVFRRRPRGGLILRAARAQQRVTCWTSEQGNQSKGLRITEMSPGLVDCASR
jgi:hypothetical protein